MKELFTRWGRNLDSEHVLQEYPRPIMMRETHYEILNGWWEYAFTQNQKKPKQYDGKPRMRRFYWKRATNIFKNYNDFDGEAAYELWIYIDPYRRGEQIGEQYGYPVYEKKPAKKGFVRVLSTYRECKTIVGNVYTEQEFE